MDIKDYKFHIGDEVITTEGEKGRIVDICNCEYCQERGFFEPTWIDENNDYYHCITKITAEKGFRGYYKIGKYKFNNDFDKGAVLREIASYEDELRGLKKQLKTIEKLESKE